MRYCKCFFILLILSSFKTVSSQTVNGNWYGVGKVQVNGTHDDYMCELILQQKNKQVKAILNYYYKDSLMSDTIKGSFDVTNRKLMLEKFPIVFYQSPSARNSVDCYMIGIFILRISKTESVLSGSFIGDGLYKYSAPTININFKRSNETLSIN